MEIPIKENDRIRCANCSRDVSKLWDYCPYCGKAIDHENESFEEFLDRFDEKIRHDPKSKKRCAETVQHVVEEWGRSHEGKSKD